MDLLEDTIPATQARSDTPAPVRKRRVKPNVTNEFVRVPEGKLIDAIKDWLDGEDWVGSAWAFRPGDGFNVRLEAQGDTLVYAPPRSGRMTAVLRRFPDELVQIPVGRRLSMPLEASALCARALRERRGA